MVAANIGDEEKIFTLLAKQKGQNRWLQAILMQTFAEMLERRNNGLG